MSRSTVHRRLAAIAVVPAVLAVTAPTSSPGESAPSSTRIAATDRYALNCAGEGVDPDSDVRYRTATFIEAPLEVVWDLQTDVAAWPSWQASVLGAERLDAGDLRPGSVFRWTTPAPETPTTPATTLEITSTVQQAEGERCLRWTGPAVGEGLQIDEGIHVWNFTPLDGGVLVRTEESWTGDQVEVDPGLSTEFLGAGLEAWLSDLTVAAEAVPVPGDGCDEPTG